MAKGKSTQIKLMNQTQITVEAFNMHRFLQRTSDTRTYRIRVGIWSRFKAGILAHVWFWGNAAPAFSS